VILVIIAVWYHLQLANLPQITLLTGVIAQWVLERITRIVKVIYRNKAGSKALIEALPGNACRVTVDMARPWTFQSGQHAYLYMPAIGLWTSHPFSVAWSEEAEQLNNEKLAMNRQDILSMKKTSMSFIIRERTGFTKKLFKKAEASPDGKFVTKCFAEGPYGGLHKVRAFPFTLPHMGQLTVKDAFVWNGHVICGRSWHHPSGSTIERFGSRVCKWYGGSEKDITGLDH
jgi:hypothetical protein